MGFGAELLTEWTGPGAVSGWGYSGKWWGRGPKLAPSPPLVKPAHFFSAPKVQLQGPRENGEWSGGPEDEFPRLDLGHYLCPLSHLGCSFALELKLEPWGPRSLTSLPRTHCLWSQGVVGEGGRPAKNKQVVRRLSDKPMGPT